jgi:hypothetical protein
LHATRAVSRKVAHCRHGKFWGHGYATMAFANDGSVDRVLIDPPFSRTMTGKCVAEALNSVKTAPYDGRSGYLRMHFYVAPH